MADPARNEICRGQGPEDARDPGGMLIFFASFVPGTSTVLVLVTLSTGSTVTVLVTLSTGYCTCHVDYGTLLVAFKAATTIRT